MLRVSEDGGRRRRREAHAAGYGELGRALLDLQAAADQVFDAVTARTAEEREKLSAISRRISAAKAKIKTLSQSEEPLTIVSPAQHPSSCTNQEDFRPLFHDKYDDNSGGPSIATISVNGGFNREYGLEGTLELFQFFSEENCDYTPKEGRLKAAADEEEMGVEEVLGLPLLYMAKRSQCPRLFLIEGSWRPGTEAFHPAAAPDRFGVCSGAPSAPGD
ncbi:Os03g0713700 [Oryza sativa Japonica Group]|uniref:Os03g0713700 protein n=1 Tax=Oryza sativa subsp. japonica TaxID=39947 RepID=A0A0P0W290_ORYSJ|nr:Os03g0713700 [Oryza sativa Japonica Group]